MSASISSSDGDEDRKIVIEEWGIILLSGMEMFLAKALP